MDSGADLLLDRPQPLSGSTDYERKVRTSETLVEVANIRLILRRLPRPA